MYSQQLVFSDSVMSDDDEIDELFSQLETIEPPDYLVDNILSAVSHLSEQGNPWHMFSVPAWENDGESFLLHKEHLEPS